MNYVENCYLIEDIVYGLVLWFSLGCVIDVLIFNIDVVIMIVLIIFECDFFEEGFIIEELGLDKLGLE